MSWQSAAAVTEVVAQKVYAAIHDVVPGSTVKVGPPTTSTAQNFTGVNVCMYGAKRNATLANHDLPTFDGGRLTRQPTAAVDLAFLLSFYGDEQRREPELLLGRVVSALNAAPFVTPADLEAATTASTSPVDLGVLTEQLQRGERIVLEMNHVSIEELYRLWTLFQVPYALTLIYTATVVMLAADEPVEPAMPVQSVGLGVGPLPPRLLAVEPREVVFGSDLSLTFDRGLGTDQLLIAGRRVKAPNDATRFSVPIDDSGMGIGAQPVVVVRHTQGGKTPGATVPVGSIALVPKIHEVHAGVRTLERDPTTGTTQQVVPVTVKLGPQVPEGTLVTLVLNHGDGGGPPWSIRVATTPENDTDTLTFSVIEPPRGELAVRVEVGGTWSRLTYHDDGTSPSPSVHIK